MKREFMSRTLKYPPDPKELEELKEARRALYRHLAADYDVKELRFMNYGYVAGEGSGPALALDPSEEMHRCQVQLYDHLARQVSLEGKRVLEVGCGRGGGAAYLARAHRPTSYTGVDLTRGAIGYCVRENRLDNLRFLVGDAEHLPFGENAFDVVINVESSHCYSPVEKFFAGVFRVLAPGGHCLLTDFRDLVSLDALRRSIHASGLKIDEEKNISRNVLEALRQESRGKTEAIVRLAPEHQWDLLQEFGGVTASFFFKSLEAGLIKYMVYVLRKP